MDQAIEAWLRSPAVRTVGGIEGWLEQGRRFGPELLDVLRKVWNAPAPAAIAKAARVGLYQYEVARAARFYPLAWLPHAKVTSPAEAKALPRSQKAAKIAARSGHEKIVGELGDSIEALHIAGAGSLKLAFVAKLPKLKSLIVDDVGGATIDFTGIEVATALEHLEVGTGTYTALPKISALTRLKSLSLAAVTSVEWLPSLPALGYLSLGAAPDLAPLASLQSLTCLVLEDAPKIRTLDGVNGQQLATVRVARCLGLTDLAALNGLPALREVSLVDLPKLGALGAAGRASKALTVSKCRKIASFELARTLEELTWSDMDAVPSLSFLSGLKALRHLDTAGTKINDKSYAPLHGLDRLVTLDAWVLPENEVLEVRKRLPYCVFNGREAFSRDPKGAPG